MELIGLAEQEKSKYPQRSPEAVYIQGGYKANGWTDDIIKKNKAAWQQYKSFIDNVNPGIQVIAKHHPSLSFMSWHLIRRDPCGGTQ